MAHAESRGLPEWRKEPRKGAGGTLPGARTGLGRVCVTSTRGDKPGNPWDSGKEKSVPNATLVPPNKAEKQFSKILNSFQVICVPQQGLKILKEIKNTSIQKGQIHSVLYVIKNY